MKRIIPFIAAIVAAVAMYAQAPEKMSYQAVIRDAGSNLITNQTIGMRISILQGSASGTVVYTETKTPTTNANGLVSIEIGGGTGFSSIDWANDIYFIKTETDPNGGTNYTITGTSQLLSVPYALHAKTAENISGGITETDPDFNASIAAGITGNDTTYWNNKLDAEVDGSVTNELQVLSISNDTIYLTNGGFVKLPAGFSRDYNDLINSPTNVSSFTNDAGYLSSEQDTMVWKNNGSGIYYNGGTVSIFDPLPPTARFNLYTYSTTNMPAFYINGGGDSQTEYVSYLLGRASLFSSTVLRLASNRVSSSGYNFIEAIQDEDGTAKTSFLVRGDGYVGIGTNSPVGKLHVNNDIVGSDSSFVVLENGRVGIGVSTPTSRLYVCDRYPFGDVNIYSDYKPILLADQTSNLHSTVNRIFASSAFNFNCALYGAVNRIISDTNQTGTISDASGAINDVVHYGSGAILTSRGSSNRVYNYGSANMTNAYAMQASIVNSGIGTINNGYGVYISAIQATNKWSLYASDATAPSYFAGNVGFGIAPVRSLHIKSVMRLEPTTTAPTSPAEGDIYMNATTHKLMVYDGTTWQACW